MVAAPQVKARWTVLFDLGYLFMTYFRLTCVAAAAALLVACGGSDDPVQGELIDPPATVATLTAAQIDAATASSGLQAISGKKPSAM